MRSLANLAPARGAPIQDVLFASLVGAILLGGLALASVLYLAGRLPVLDRLARWVERAQGVPAWAAVPMTVAGASLGSAVFGFYWDVSWHIDRGRDPGPFANPAHWCIIWGLVGVVAAGVASLTLLSEDDVPRTA